MGKSVMIAKLDLDNINMERKLGVGYRRCTTNSVDSVAVQLSTQQQLCCFLRFLPLQRSPVLGQLPWTVMGCGLYAQSCV